MPESGREFVAAWRANARRLAAAGLYNPADEHEACGVGFVAAVDGKPRRSIVEAGINALKAVWHRGAVSADGKTGDGAGIHVQIPQDFFKQHIARTGHEPHEGPLAVGMVFLPKTDLAAQETCRAIVESEILRFGYNIYGWRQVPVDSSVIGETANATRPEVEQIMIDNRKGGRDEKFERDLYIIRRRIEKAVLDQHIGDFYICSLSCHSLIYKGMFLAEQLTAFYPDLLDARFVSNFAIYHQRYSTNTFPTWRLAQPFRMLAHNGEINTLRGNANWMQSHEIRMASDAFGDHAEDIKPIIQAGSSDSAALDAVFEALVRGGRSAPLAKTVLIPESWSQKTTMSEAHRALYSYCNCVMEPWDGPAAIVASDGRWIVAGMDRNGLRPLRYWLTADGLVVVGSEAGMVPFPETEIAEKGRVGPGQMIAIDSVEGRFYRDSEIKDMLAAEHPYGRWVESIGHLPEIKVAEPEPLAGEALRRRQIAAGYSMEEIEIILHPMVEDGKEPTGSMGDDTPLAVLSERYRGLHHFFRQFFSQVTNPPIDSLRENRVMSLKTRLGNLGNVLAQSSSQTEIVLFESPVLSNRDFHRLCAHVGEGAVEIDCTFAVASETLRRALNRVRDEAEDAVRQGRAHIILSDSNVGPERAPVPMILAAGGVHSHLVREGLRTFTSLHVRSGECFDVHNFAVLIGVGATTVNPYLAEETIADRCARGLFGGLSAAEACTRYRGAVDQGLLKIISKLGISVVSSYRGGRNFEAVGAVAGAGGRVLPRHGFAHLGHRSAGDRAQGGGTARKCVRRGFEHPSPRRAVPVSRLGRGPRHGGNAHPHASGRGRQRCLRPVQALYPGARRNSAGQSPRPHGPRAQVAAAHPRSGGIDHRDSQALRHRLDVARCALARGARDLGHRHEPHRRPIVLGRGRRGHRARRAARPTETTRTRRSSRSPRPASASPPSTSTIAPRSRSRSPRAPSLARAVNYPASRSRPRSRACASRPRA